VDLNQLFKTPIRSSVSFITAAATSPAGGGNLKAVIDRAEQTTALASGGVDGIIVEIFRRTVY